MVLDYREEALLGGDDAVGGGGDPAERGRPHPRPHRPRGRRRRGRRLGRGCGRRGRGGPSHLLYCHPGRGPRGGSAAHVTREHGTSLSPLSTVSLTPRRLWNRLFGCFVSEGLLRLTENRAGVGRVFYGKSAEPQTARCLVT